MASMPMPQQPGSAASIGRRTSARARVRLPGIIETLDGRRRVDVRNLSTVGAMVEAHGVPAVGKDLVFKCFGIDAMGVVVWEAGDRCGIEFYDPIDEDEVIRQRKLSEDEFERRKWCARQDALLAAERWSQGRNR